MIQATERIVKAQDVPVSEELAEEARKWREAPKPPPEPRKEEPRPRRGRSVWFDLD